MPGADAIKNSGQDIVFGDEAAARNAADGKYIDTRNTNIANELATTTNFADMSVGSMRKFVQEKLAAR